MPSWPFGSLRDYRRPWLRSDVLTGLTVWAVLVPESLAYATAGGPPVVGLYATVPALQLCAVLGSSRHLVVGPMSATAALSAGIVAVFAAGGTDGTSRSPRRSPSSPGCSASSQVCSGWASSPRSSPGRCSRASSSGWP